MQQAHDPHHHHHHDHHQTQSDGPSTGARLGSAVMYGGAAFLAATGVIAGVNYAMKFNSSEAQKRRRVCVAPLQQGLACFASAR